jgi:hypothetical protein
MLAKARAKSELREEAKQEALRNTNRPPPGYRRPADDFQQAADRLAAMDEWLREFDRQCMLEELAIERHFRLRRKAIAVRKRAEEILRQTEYLATPRKKR